jgi:hypothetical protein
MFCLQRNADFNTALNMKKIFRLSLGEIFLLQLIFWLTLWLLNDFIATLLTLCIGAVVSAVLIVALLAEVFERSKVPRQYFYIMGISILCMVLAAGIYILIFGGRLTFLTK